MVFSEDDDVFHDVPAPAPAPAPTLKKSSLFGPSKFARPIAKVPDPEDEDDEAISLFNRRDDVFASVVREEAARREQRERARERLRERQMKKESIEPEVGRRGKKRRTSDQFDSGSDIEEPRPSSRRKSSSVKSTPTKERATSASNFKYSPSRRSSSDLQNLPEPAALKGHTNKLSEGPISLDSDDNESIGSKSPIIQPFSVVDRREDTKEVKNLTISQPDEDQDEEPSDEEFPELVAQAKARQKEQEQTKRDQLLAARNQWSSPRGGGLQNSAQASSSSGSSYGLDAAVMILVSSDIIGTKPTVLKRKLSQRLKEVKSHWIDKQLIDGKPIPEHIRSRIFLTWRGSRVFDVTTCNSLGIKVSADGRIEADGDGFEGGQIHLQAWTQELYDDWKKRREAARLRRFANPEDESEAEEEPTAEEIAAQKAAEPAKIKIILKAKNYDDFKLVVRSETVFQKVLNAIIQHHGLRDTPLQLFFDGDPVDPATTVGELDLEDMDVLDVHM